MRSLLKKLKLRYLYLRSAINRAILRLKGVQVHPTALIFTLPRIKKAAGSTIIIGKNVTIHSNWKLNPVIRVPSTLATLTPHARIELKENSGMSGACICAAKEVIIGEGTIIAPNVFILDNDFHIPGSNFTWLGGIEETAKEIRIGKGCFITTAAIILKGVIIGDETVVSAGTTVCQSVGTRYVVYGSPQQTKPLPSHLQHPV